MSQGRFLAPKPDCTAQVQTPLSKVVELFCHLGLRHLPVVSHDGQLRGMITRQDLYEGIPRLRHEVMSPAHSARRVTSHESPAGREDDDDTSTYMQLQGSSAAASSSSGGGLFAGGLFDLQAREPAGYGRLDGGDAAL